MTSTGEIRLRLAAALRPFTKKPNRAVDAVLGTYDVPGLLDDLSVLNAENHRLLDLVDAALPDHDQTHSPHAPASSHWCEGCTRRGHTPWGIVYPMPHATYWLRTCYHVEKGRPRPCPECEPPRSKMCPENIQGGNDLYYQCKLLGEHTAHRDGNGTTWWPEDESDENDGDSAGSDTSEA